MNREVLRLFSLVIALSAFGCSVGTEPSDDGAQVTSEDIVTPSSAEAANEERSAGSLGTVREALGLMIAHPVGIAAGPEPDPWHANKSTQNEDPAGGPEPDPWHPKAHRVAPSADPSAGSTTTDKH